ncbi:MAG: hypothetical protein IJ058_01875 [Lachnospiraceae bacterium]|nr:hypothetical protein [Lachnospiraceae bacterium]
MNRLFEQAYFDEIKTLLLTYAFDNYDYCFLDEKWKLCHDTRPDVVMCGSSYMMDGFRDDVSEYNTVNLSISSQDLYYIREVLRRYISEIKKPDIFVFSGGRYILYHDLSMQSRESITIPRTLYRVYGVSHHKDKDLEFDPARCFNTSYEIFREPEFLAFADKWTRELIKENGYRYYGTVMRADRDFADTWSGYSSWTDMPEEVKKAAAAKRTDSHNKLKKYIETFNENVGILTDICRICVENSIVPVLAMYPHSANYMELIDSSYTEELMNVMEQIPYPLHYIDMNADCELFTNDDFRDADHLSEAGAFKATALIDELLGEIYASGVS